MDPAGWEWWMVGESSSDNVFKLIYRGERGSYFFSRGSKITAYSAKSGSSSTHQPNAIEMAFRWRVDDGPTLDAGWF